MGQKLTTQQLHQILIDALGDSIYSHSDISEKPLLIKLNPPYNWDLKIYLYNCTNPPGGRQAGEYKSQIILPGQKRGERGSFTTEFGTTTLLMGFACLTDNFEDGIFVLWDLKKHMEFAYSANVQVSLSTLLRAYSDPVFAMKKKGNGEWIVVAQVNHVLAAIKKRQDIDIELLLEE